MVSEYPPFGDDWRKRWCQIGRSSVLHRVATTEGDYETEDRVGTQGTTACGKAGWLGMPGIFSRMDAPRCPACCRAVGIPRGRGAPYNDEAGEHILSAEQREL